MILKQGVQGFIEMKIQKQFKNISRTFQEHINTFQEHKRR